MNNQTFQQHLQTEAERLLTEFRQLPTATRRAYVQWLRDVKVTELENGKELNIDGIKFTTDLLNALADYFEKHIEENAQ